MIVATKATRRETPTKIPVPHVPTPTRRCKKRRDEITDSEKDETGSKLNEIVGVMKDSAHDLVARSQSLAHDFIRRGSASSSGCLNSQAECHDTTAVISRSKPPAWHSLTRHQTLPRAPMQARPRISQEASTSSSQADHAQAQQHPMHPPPPPPQDQRLPLVLDSWSCCIPSLMKW